ncbi:MAG: FtsQ-type POTRA domain-containing protein [Desulfobulbaceae bacterium]|jgi:cell division septal protein FtsQ|nr:FtsQ-type POTRA domain-containing protein [Desulfobulbaceae bacterium]
MNADYMYKPPGMKKRGRFRALTGRLAAWSAERLRRTFSRRKGKGRGPLARQQRSWQLQKLTQKFVLGLLVLVLLSCGGWLSYTLLARSDIFQATELTVRGNSMATRQEILETGGLNLRVNLLALDTGAVKDRIIEHPWIDQVTIKRRWPSTLEVTVHEHKPLALINLRHEGDSLLYYVDHRGILFAPHSPSMDLDYPVLSGETLAALTPGTDLTEDALGVMAVELLNLAAQGNQILPLQAVSEVHVSREKGLIVYLVDHPFPIYMGREQMRTRFRQLVQVLAQLYRQDKVKEIREIRMDYAENKILVANAGK